jgi:hypothetical protein
MIGVELSKISCIGCSMRFFHARNEGLVERELGSMKESRNSANM